MKHVIFVLVASVLFYTCAGTSSQVVVDLQKPADIAIDDAMARLSGALRIKTVSYSDSAATEAIAFNTFINYLSVHYPLTP